jgi:hypothetical protein
MRGWMWWCAIAALALSGCAVTPERIAGPDGKDAYFLKCGVGMDAAKKCLIAAAQTCPGGYTVVDKTSQVLPSQWGPVSAITMTVSCKD